MGTSSSQCISPALRIGKEERFFGAGHEVDTRQPAWHDRGRLVAGPRRSTKHHAVDIGMAKSGGERKLTTKRSPHTAVRSTGNAMPRRVSTQLRTSSTKKRSWAANRELSIPGTYSFNRSSSSATP